MSKTFKGCNFVMTDSKHLNSYVGHDCDINISNGHLHIFCMNRYYRILLNEYRIIDEDGVLIAKSGVGVYVFNLKGDECE